MARRTSTIFALGSLALIAFFAFNDLPVQQRRASPRPSENSGHDSSKSDARTVHSFTFAKTDEVSLDRRISLWDESMGNIPGSLRRNKLDVLFSSLRGDEIRLPVLPDFLARVTMLHRHEDGTEVVGLGFPDFPGAIAYFQRGPGGEVSGHLIWDLAEKGIEIGLSSDDTIRLVLRPTDGMMCSRIDGSFRQGGLPQASVAMEAAPAPAQNGGGSGAIPLLQSNPGAAKTLYLDFDGETVTGTSWNLQYNDGDPIVAAPYGNPAAIESIWKSISEDYRVFNVNVTTDRAVFNASTSRNRSMVIFTPSREWYGNAGGVAYTRSFGSSINYMCWSFNAGSNAAAESGSHEAGHQMGLNHDGKDGSSYYPGHTHPGSRIGWAPIMGLSYGKHISQFSKGDYAGSTEKQDDLDIIGDTLGHRPDDFGNNRENATAASGLEQGRINLEGVIGADGDVDCIMLPLIRSGAISLNVEPSSPYTNLDLKIALTREDGSVVATSAPENSFAASMRTSVLPAGKYFLSVSGSSLGTPTNGYPVYGSVGGYRITGSCPPVGPAASPAGFEATDGTLTTHVQLTWSAEPLASSYRVYRSSTSLFSSFALLAEVSMPDYEDRGAALDTTYRYYVTAVNPLGESDPTPIDTGFRQEIPDMARNLVASDARYSAYTKLEWGAATRASGYRVFRNLRATTVGAVEIGTTSENTFEDREALAGESYYYFVRSFNAAGVAEVNSFDSGSRSASLAAPISVLASRGGFEGGVSIQFEAVSGSTRYTIFRATSDDPREAEFIGTTTNLEFYDKTANPGVSHTYYVRAEGGSGDSPLSSGATGSAGYATAGDDPFEANDRIEESYPLTAYEGRWLGPKIGSAIAMDADWFEVIPRAGATRLDLILSHETGADLELTLRDSGGTVLATAESIGNASVISHDRVVPGQSYHLLVESSAPGAGYNLLWRSVTAGGTTNRSDLVIGGSPASDLGRFIFEPTARSQKVRSLVKGTRTVKSFASAVNEGVEAATVTAAGTRSNGWVRFTHFVRMGTIVRNISAAMRLDGVEQDLPPLDSMRFEIRTRPSKKAVKRRSSVSGIFTTSVSGFADTRDSGCFVYPIRKR